MTLSVYIHIPFCSRRCDYCDFATWTDKSDLIEEYVTAVENQIRFHRAQGQFGEGKELTSIFFGGGTPNLIHEKYISRIIDALSEAAVIGDKTEITIECNPDHVSVEKMRLYKSAGVNRVSLGIQSTNIDVLKFIGREHNPEHVSKARAIIDDVGISNVSGDVIYGAAVETVADWTQTLNDLMNLELSHISAYSLGVEPGTPLGRSVTSGQKSSCDEDDLADKYEVADAMLKENGFEWYEISNWSKPGKQSKHNMTYWRGGDVIALGCAAHGTISGRRWATPRNIEVYLERFSASRNSGPIKNSDFIYPTDVSGVSDEEEAFALKLRTRKGVVFPSDANSEILKQYIQEGFVEREFGDDNISLTPKGRLMAHQITIGLFQEYEQISKSCTIDS